MKNLLTAIALLAATCTPVAAGTILPLTTEDKPRTDVTMSAVVCATDTLITDVLDNFQTYVDANRLPDGCLFFPMLRTSTTPEFRYLDDEGDLTQVFSLEQGGWSFALVSGESA